MKDDGNSTPLSRRVPGSTRSGPGQPARPVFSDTDVHRIQAAIDAEHADTEMPSQCEPNTEPIPVVTASGPGTKQAGNPPATTEHAGKAPRATKAPRAEESLRAAGALRAAAELRAAEKPRSAAGRLRPDEPVIAPEPMRAPESARAGRPVIAPEQVVPPAPVPVPLPEPPHPPEQVSSPEAAHARQPVAPQPVVAAEPPRRVEPPRATWPLPEPAPGQIGWLWPEDNGTGTGTPRYRPRGRTTASGGWRYRTATLVALGAVVLAAGGIVIGMSLRGHAAAPSAGAKTSAQARAKTSPAYTTRQSSAPGIQPGPLAGGLVGINEQLAAAWAAHQLSPGTIVACDPQMCSALAAGGFPTGQQAQLAQNSQSLSGASLVAVTPRLRQLFAARPSFGTDVAPVVLASFGTGRALVTIQPVDPAGGAAYQASFSKDVQDRIRVGQELLNSGKVVAAPKAKRALLAGDVDPRILLAIKALIQQLAGVKIASFGDSGPSVSPGVPFRAANFVATDLSAGETPQAYLQQMIAVLRAHASFPAIQHATPVTMANGLTAVGIMYFAPTPLGLVSGG
jgi:hypothetical protein